MKFVHQFINYIKMLNNYVDTERVDRDPLAFV